MTVLTPVLALVTWTLIVWIWMYAVRIPAMNAAKLDPQSARFPGSLNVLPDHVRQVADNYNHLLEQPVIFYALVFYIYLAGTVDSLAITLAWAYVVLRVVHSLIQCTINRVPLRFTVFALSTLVLMVLAVREIVAFA
ncbi:MAG TPA: MAPEG family protein [Rhizomicrobium sp.]